MPQASEELRNKFPGMDTQAINYLEQRGFKCGKDFVWRPPSMFHNLTQHDKDAIDYLCDEWDYGYEHKV